MIVHVPKLSVVTINLNDRHGLLRTAESVGAQSDQDFEWVVADGGSLDGSMEVLDNPNVRRPDKARSARDLGIYDAMNTALKLTSGEFIQFLNSGDTFVGPDAVSVIKRSISRSDAPDCALFGFEYRKKRRGPRPLWWRFWSLPTSHQAMAYRRTLLLEHAFDDSYRFAGDFEHFLRVSSLGYRVRRYPDVVIWNDEYGCKKHLATVQGEYQRALQRVLWPSAARMLIWARFGYLRKVV